MLSALLVLFIALLSIMVFLIGGPINYECRIAESNRSKPSYEDGASTYRPILLVVPPQLGGPCYI